VEVDGDGNCLVHSASVGLTGTQRYFDALRFAIYKVGLYTLGSMEGNVV
jgi:hypothetical protein